MALMRLTLYVPSRSFKDGQWYSFNDQHVSTVSVIDNRTQRILRTQGRLSERACLKLLRLNGDHSVAIAVLVTRVCSSVALCFE